MSLPYKAVVDTSCFILLHKIDELTLLRKLFDKVVTSEEVIEEFGHELPNWIHIQKVADVKYQTALELKIDKGEASVLALSAEIKAPVAILDDMQARKIARKLGLKMTGTLGLIAKAKTEGIIASVKPIITKIEDTNFRFSEEVFLAILKAAGEE